MDCAHAIIRQNLRGRQKQPQNLAQNLFFWYFFPFLFEIQCKERLALFFLLFITNSREFFFLSVQKSINEGEEPQKMVLLK